MKQSGVNFIVVLKVEPLALQGLRVCLIFVIRASYDLRMIVIVIVMRTRFSQGVKSETNKNSSLVWWRSDLHLRTKIV